MPNPRFGYLCLFENPTLEAGRALTRQAVLAREAERMRYEDIWVDEHHFDPVWAGSATAVMLGYLAGVTLRARIGSAALLPAFHNPVQLAENVASLDLLTKGRFNFGVASGAAFPGQARQFGVARADLAERELEALELIRRLLTEEKVTHAGKHFKLDGVTLEPRPDQPVPVWVATTTESTIRHAARQGYGLMASATCKLDDVRRYLAIYRDEAPQGNPRLVLARFGFTDNTRGEAMAVAEPYARAFAERMARERDAHPDTPRHGEFDADKLLEMSFVGSYEEVAEQVNQLNVELGLHGIAIAPTTENFDLAKKCLAKFVDEIRLRLPAD